VSRIEAGFGPCVALAEGNHRVNLPQIAQIKGKHIWKPLEAQLARPTHTPSQLWRCVVETAQPGL
jgi:hypothetical protein